MSEVAVKTEEKPKIAEFLAVASRRLWQQVFTVAAVVGKEVALRAVAEGLAVRAMDPSHVMLLQLTAPREVFVEYSVEAEGMAGVIVPKVRCVLRRFGREELTVRAADEKLEIRGERKRFKLPLMEVTADEEIPEPKVEFTAELKLLSKPLLAAVEDSRLVSDHVRFEYGDEKLTVKAVGDLGEAENVFNTSEVLLEAGGDACKATFSTTFLRDVLKAVADLSEVVEIRLATDMPLFLSAQSPQGLEVEVWIAPCVGV